ncbi:hypothetical protein B0H11DRAFT_1924176 [Mycena galericulata]|nr:hypothetical protein B0H11DRAFT_1924176 [Mycena galericulata]
MTHCARDSRTEADADREPNSPRVHRNSVVYGKFLSVAKMRHIHTRTGTFADSRHMSQHLCRLLAGPPIIPIKVGSKVRTKFRIGPAKVGAKIRTNPLLDPTGRVKSSDNGSGAVLRSDPRSDNRVFVQKPFEPLDGFFALCNLMTSGSVKQGGTKNSGSIWSQMGVLHWSVMPSYRAKATQLHNAKKPSDGSNGFCTNTLIDGGLAASHAQ